MWSESGSEFWRDATNRGKAASALVTAAEIPSAGGKGRRHSHEGNTQEKRGGGIKMTRKYLNAGCLRVTA